MIRWALLVGGLTTGLPPHHDRCMSCYQEIKGEEIEIGGTVLRKSELIKEKNDKVSAGRTGLGCAGLLTLAGIVGSIVDRCT